MFIPLIPPPSSEFAMNYFIVRNDDDLFVFRKKNCFWNKKFPKKHKKLFRFLCAGVLLACCFEGIVCLRCCCGKHNFKRLNSHYTIFSEYNWKLNLFRFMLLSGYRLNKQIELRAIICLLNGNIMTTLGSNRTWNTKSLFGNWIIIFYLFYEYSFCCLHSRA